MFVCSFVSYTLSFRWISMVCSDSCFRFNLFSSQFHNCVPMWKRLVRYFYLQLSICLIFINILGIILLYRFLFSTFSMLLFLLKLQFNELVQSRSCTIDWSQHQKKYFNIEICRQMMDTKFQRKHFENVCVFQINTLLSIIVSLKYLTTHLFRIFFVLKSGFFFKK